MDANIKTNTVAKESSKAAIDSLSRATMMTMAGISGLVGLWAAACIVGAIVTNGPLGLVQGFVSALIG